MSFKSHLISNVFLVRWERPEPGDMARILGQVRVASTQNKRLAYLAVVPEECAVPEEDVRSEILRGLTVTLRYCQSVRLVIEGTGFRYATMRSIASGMLFVMNLTDKVSIHSHARGALQRMALDVPEQEVLDQAVGLGLLK